LPEPEDCDEKCWLEELLELWLLLEKEDELELEELCELED